MKQLSDRIVAKLQAEMQVPDLAGTRYSVVRHLARGGMGSVWLADDMVLNRRVALKVLDLVAPADDLGALLLREARILAGLEHPGIVPVHDAGTLADGRAFYCMKYVEGQTLAQHIVGKNLSEKLRLLERIAEPLDFAHARGFIHRDLKPENIMIGAFGEVLVMDWGLAKVAAAGRKPTQDGISMVVPDTQDSSRVTGQGSVLGTPGYMSPEQEGGGNEVDHRTDIFSMGALLAFMLTGISSEEAPTATRAVPRPLRAICEKAMASDPNARYQSAREMAADTARYLSSEPVLAYPEGLFERVGRIYARHRTAIVLVGAYLLMRVFFILFAHR
ncbi:MAG: serine/threonine-protein kinase [Candidatus Sulfotelmatobacter sp.]